MIDSFMSVITNINIIFYILAYLIGGIPFGFLLCWIFFRINITQLGSKSIGATNVYRVLKNLHPNWAKKISIITIFFDSIKGMILILAAKLFGLDYSSQWMISILTIIGHCYSPYLKFYGGKGVATAIGSVLLLIPIEGILGLLIWGIVGKIVKISSISSLIGVLSGIIFTFIIPHFFHLPQNINISSQVQSHIPVLIIGYLIIITHIPNIKRIFKGEEEKVLDPR